MEARLASKTPKYLARPVRIVIRPAPGWGALLLRELAHISSTPFARYKFAPEVKLDSGALHVGNVDFRQALEWCARLTVAHDVEWIVWDGKCRNWEQLTRAAESIREIGFLPENSEGSDPVNAQVIVSANSSFVVSSSKIRQAFVTALGVALEQDSNLRFRLDLYRDKLSVFVSLAGDPLYKRGYKRSLRGAVAPLPEHQAAACIRSVIGFESPGPLAAFDRDTPALVFIPFAGTGTLGLEWWIACTGAGPGSFPRAFAFEKFAKMPAATLRHLRRNLDPTSDVEGIFEGATVSCLERNEEVARDLRSNIDWFCHLTGARRDIFRVVQGDFFKSEAEAALRSDIKSGDRVTILLNPPYGQRLKIPDEARRYYQRIAERIMDLEVRLGISIEGCCIVPEARASAAFAKSLAATHSVETAHFTHGGEDTRLVVFRSTT
jgi:23S rRNA G2445 N2-methylase RlmL